MQMVRDKHDSDQFERARRLDGFDRTAEQASVGFVVKQRSAVLGDKGKEESPPRPPVPADIPP
jgi:hypothetical protein